ncbi:MAG: hypothetical protein COB76_06165 [Alphaproteobacteria bacterium]|nr:MAG: hypothetical protein COB76_06165 [Alphaproteobacteria bacterium]
MLKKFFILCILATAAIFSSTTILIVFGMMPTLACFAIDKTIGKSKTICVGFMNFAGCFPFLLDFWTKFGQQNMENALSMIADIENMLVIYVLAGGGYAIDVAVTGITATLIIQRAENRVKRIKKNQEKFEKNWGSKVTGKYILDEHGFPVEGADQRTQL